MQLSNTFTIIKLNILSDHSMIRFCLLIDSILNENNNVSEGLERQSSTYKWDETKRLEYLDKLSQPYSVDQLNNITERLFDVAEAQALNDNLNEFYEIINEVCDPLFKKKLNASSSINNKSTDQPWFDEDCKSKRKEFYKCLNGYRNDKCEENRKRMTETRSDYKCTIRNSKYRYDKKRTLKLEKAWF